MGGGQEAKGQSAGLPLSRRHVTGTLEELEKLANSLKDTDNPVLVLVRLKD